MGFRRRTRQHQRRQRQMGLETNGQEICLRLRPRCRTSSHARRNPDRLTKRADIRRTITPSQVVNHHLPMPCWLAATSSARPRASSCTKWNLNRVQAFQLILKTVTAGQHQTCGGRLPGSLSNGMSHGLTDETPRKRGLSRFYKRDRSVFDSVRCGSGGSEDDTAVSTSWSAKRAH